MSSVDCLTGCGSPKRNAGCCAAFRYRESWDRLLSSYKCGTMTSLSDATGIMLGLACGDALGRPVEFRSSDWIADHHGTVTAA